MIKILFLVFSLYFLFKVFVSPHLAFRKIIKYTGIDEIDINKKESAHEKLEALEKKLAEKAQLINYKIMRGLDSLIKIKYLSPEEYEHQKELLRVAMENMSYQNIIIPEINPILLDDLCYFEPELFAKFFEIVMEQKTLIYITNILMPKVFGHINK